MPASFEQILNSRIFKFTVGQNVDSEATTFSVHEEVFAALSQHLHALMRSGFSESENGHAIWEDVSKETFVRFAQFAYTGDYSVPLSVIPDLAPDLDPQITSEPAEDKAKVEEPQPEKEPETVDWGSWGTTASKKAKKKKKQFVVEWEPRVLEPFPTSPLSLISPRNKYEDTCEPSDKFEPRVRYSTLFISHASLWILGNYRDVESLKALSLYKLHKTLCAFEPVWGREEDLIDLVRCAYSERGAALGGEISSLRELVCQYLGKHKEILREDGGFMELLAEGGQFVKDFFRYS